MAVLLIIDEEATSVEGKLASDVLYITSHRCLNDAQGDLKAKQYDFVLMRFDPSMESRDDITTRVIECQPDARFIWLVSEHDRLSYQGRDDVGHDDYICDPVTKEKVLDIIGGDLISQSQVDDMIAKKRDE